MWVLMPYHSWDDVLSWQYEEDFYLGLSLFTRSCLVARCLLEVSKEEKVKKLVI